MLKRREKEQQATLEMLNFIAENLLDEDELAGVTGGTSYTSIASHSIAELAEGIRKVDKF